MTSFLIIDDHPLFREALGNAVRPALPDAVIFEAMSIDDALRIAESTVKAHVTEILRKLKLFTCNKAVIEISKIDLPVPKGRPGLKADRSKLQ
jgi:DNA-binding NarL/FixJ family response regulator